jgi:hypothetical protein
MTMTPRLVIPLLLVWTLSCKEPPVEHGPEPMRVPAKPATARQAAMAGSPGTPAVETGEEPEPEGWITERPPADPEIEHALELISASELVFLDPASEPGETSTEYTGKDFASMLRTKWDWIGYDLVVRDAWLDGVATRSFKTNHPYQVVLANGTTTEFRPWLEAALAQKRPNQ